MESRSRGTEIDTHACVDLVGGSKYDLVLIVAARARELSAQHRASASEASVHSPVSALLDVQNGLVGREYLLKVGKGR
jgi:DNA-directed RNA polymerase subunit K/omega